MKHAYIKYNIITCKRQFIIVIVCGRVADPKKEIHENGTLCVYNVYRRSWEPKEVRPPASAHTCPSSFSCHSHPHPSRLHTCHRWQRRIHAHLRYCYTVPRRGNPSASRDYLACTRAQTRSSCKYYNIQS